MKLVLVSVALITATAPSSAQLVFGIENHASGSDRLVRIDLATSEITPIGYTGGTLFYTGLAFGPDGHLYGSSMSTSFNYRGFRRIDLATGQATLLGMGGLPSGEFIHDLELNLVDDQIYGVGKSSGGSIHLYTFDLTTGSASLAQTVTDPFGILPLGLGIDPTGRVFMFSSQPEDRMYEVVGGVLQPLPADVGFDASFSQGMTFDPNDGTWYLGGYDWTILTTVFHRIDPATGAGPLIASFPNREFGDIAILDFASHPIGQSFCASAPNSTGQSASIGAFGSDAAAENIVLLSATQLPAGQNGIFFFGPQQTQTVFGNGFLCVGGALTRLDPPEVISSSGEAHRMIDVTDPPAAGTIVSGSTWSFQFWYRDPAAGGAFFNLSDGLTVAFQ